jgi:hypothetical protein
LEKKIKVRKKFFFFCRQRVNGGRKGDVHRDPRSILFRLMWFVGGSTRFPLSPSFAQPRKKNFHPFLKKSQVRKKIVFLPGSRIGSVGVSFHDEQEINDYGSKKKNFFFCGLVFFFQKIFVDKKKDGDSGNLVNPTMHHIIRERVPGGSRCKSPLLPPFTRPRTSFRTWTKNGEFSVNQVRRVPLAKKTDLIRLLSRRGGINSFYRKETEKKN